MIQFKNLFLNLEKSNLPSMKFTSPPMHITCFPNSSPAICARKKALEYFVEYSELKDSTLSEENLNIISELEKKYETEKKELEIEKLNTDKALQETQIKQQQRLIIIFIFGFAIISGLSILLYRQFAAKKKANILLEHQNVEIKKQRF